MLQEDKQELINFIKDKKEDIDNPEKYKIKKSLDAFINLTSELTISKYQYICWEKNSKYVWISVNGEKRQITKLYIELYETPERVQGKTFINKNYRFSIFLQDNGRYEWSKRKKKEDYVRIVYFDSRFLLEKELSVDENIINSYKDKFSMNSPYATDKKTYLRASYLTYKSIQKIAEPRTKTFNLNGIDINVKFIIYDKNNLDTAEKEDYKEKREEKEYYGYFLKHFYVSGEVEIEYKDEYKEYIGTVLNFIKLQKFKFGTEKSVVIKDINDNTYFVSFKKNNQVDKLKFVVYDNKDYRNILLYIDKIISKEGIDDMSIYNKMINETTSKRIKFMHVCDQQESDKGENKIDKGENKYIVAEAIPIDYKTDTVSIMQYIKKIIESVGEDNNRGYVNRIYFENTPTEEITIDMDKIQNKK